MTEQPIALRLADELEMWTLGEPAAAELRRLHQFAEDQIGRATAAEAALQMTKATHALKIAAVEAQRNALLGALKVVEPLLAPEVRKKARAVIKAAEGEKT